jgi:hypothetical protein
MRAKVVPALVLCSLLGCPLAESGPGEPGEEMPTSGTSADPADTDPTDSQASTAGTDPDTTTGDDTSDSESEGTSSMDSTTGGDGPLPNGAACALNAECDSGFCYEPSPVGGTCSECGSDSDCENTCSFGFGFRYAICTDGSLGKPCDSDEGCQGDLVCAEVVDWLGYVPAYCSECSTSDQCDGDDICTPHYDEASWSGYLYCAEPGSVPNGGGCPIDRGQGYGEVCENGHCGIVGTPRNSLGLCGSCSTDDDCEGAETCVPASGDGLHGAYCE